MLLIALLAVAEATCPATPDHIADACGGCRPVFQDLAQAGFAIDEPSQREIERCVRGALGAEQRRPLTSAKACVLESDALSDDVSAWLGDYIDEAKRLDDLDRPMLDRQWGQCAAEIQHYDARPSLCVVEEDIGLERATMRGAQRVAMKLALENRCVREVTCAVTVSASRSAPASDGVTGIEEIRLDPGSNTVAAVRLRFPEKTKAELAHWSVEGLMCRYAQRRKDVKAAAAVADAE